MIHWILMLVMLGGVGFYPAEASDKTTIGQVEYVVLLPGRVKLPARIDTGASMSSLDVRQLRVKGQRVWFQLPKKYGGLQLQAPLVDRKSFLSSEGRDLRPVVELELCLGKRRFTTLVNLNDRSHLTYPFLVGRRVLKYQYLVDVSQSYTVQPQCREAQP